MLLFGRIPFYPASVGNGNKKTASRAEKRKSYVAFSQSIADSETSGLHRLFLAIGRRQISWIEKCKRPFRRKRNRQSEAEARGDVEERRSIAAETVQKLPEKPWNFDASGVYKLATITNGTEIGKTKLLILTNGCKRKYGALDVFTGYRRQSIIESDFNGRILFTMS